MNRWSLDVEVYANYFLAYFTNGDRVVTAELFEGSPPWPSDAITEVLGKHPLVSFNGNSFDLPLIALACTGADNAALKVACDRLIAGERPWQVCRVPAKWQTNHVDLEAVAAGVRVGLKTYGARMGTKTIMDLPIEPSAMIAPEQRPQLIHYCGIDNRLNLELLEQCAGAVQLRHDIAKELGLPAGELLGKTDPQIAEMIFRVKLGARDRAATPPTGHLRYRVPDYIQFRTAELQAIRQMVDSAEYPMLSTGTAGMPRSFGPFQFHTVRYQLGVGGLHSISKSMHVEGIRDVDVASLYPSLILNHGWSPEGMTGFPYVYRQIYRDRFEAKAAGDKVKDAAFKLALNGSYGKFGSKYSFLYAPQLLLNTCMTGQLSLLMLIEALVLEGATVYVANTDSVSYTSDRDLSSVMRRWEMITGLRLEGEQFAHLWSRDVNNYLAIRPDGSVKGKGFMAKPSLQSTPRYQICRDAVIAYLTAGTPIQDTLTACTDMAKFVAVRNVTGGFVGGGKVARWYVAYDGQPLVTKKKGDQVAGTGVGVKVALELPDQIPDDLNFPFYYQETIDMLGSLGCKI